MNDKQYSILKWLEIGTYNNNKQVWCEGCGMQMLEMK